MWYQAVFPLASSNEVEYLDAYCLLACLLAEHGIALHGIAQGIYILFIHSTCLRIMS